MWRTFIREYLRFSRKERQGIVMLVLAMVLTSYFPDLLFYFQRRPVADSDDLKAAVQAFEAQLAVNSATPGFSHTGAKAPPALFYFDPNSLLPEDWRRLGVSERTAGTIGKYLAKGGRFRVAADLEKVYGLPPALCAQLIPYVRIKAGNRFSGRDDPGNDYVGPNRSRCFEWVRGGRGSHNDGGAFRGDSNATGFREDNGATSRNHNGAAFRNHNYPMDSSFVRYRKKAPPAAIDVNTADSSVWQLLPGIGPGFARRIIAFRDRLGGFYAVEQVAECYGLPDSVFQKIQPFLQIGSSSLKKLDLNGSDEKSLAAHPYIRYKLARLIVQYRSSHAGFKEVSDLRRLPLVDEIIYRKIEHYIEIKL